MAKDILNKSGKVVYASYNAHDTYIVIKISDDIEPSIYVLASNFRDKIKTEFESLSELCEYFGITPCLDDWVGSYEMDCSKTKFKLSEVIEFKIDETKDDINISDSNEQGSYCTEVNTTHIDKDTYITQVPPLNLSDDTLKKQAEYTANALEKIQNTKKANIENVEYIESEEVSTEYTLDDFYKVVQGVNPEELAHILYIKGALLLVSPPGTGKTTTAIELAKYIEKETNSDRVEILSFNQMTSYDDFIGGYKKSSNGDWETNKGTFFKLCDRANKDLSNKYILIIDEINRANTEEVLGEALSGMSQRGKKFKTNIGLNMVVPENLYIIATMNSTDSSITNLDTALVDRFAIYNMPEIELNIEKIGDVQKNVVGVQLVANAIKEINAILSQDVYKGADNKIGNRALFTNYSCTDDLIMVVKYDITPKVESKLSTLTKAAKDNIREILNKLVNDLLGV